MKHIFKLRGREIIDLLIEFLYLAIIFIVPLYFSLLFPTENIFELSKSVIFKILLYLILFLSLIKLAFYYSDGIFKNIKNSKVLIKLNKHHLIPGIFILGLGVSLFFSINLAQSFFGSYRSQAGYLNYLAYFIWFVLLVFNIKTINNEINADNKKESIQKKIQHILITITLSGFLVAVYGILQILGIDFLIWQEDPMLTLRAVSTFGQPNFLASWLLLIIPISAYLVYESKNFLIRFFYLLVFFAQLACLISTSSRGAFVALAIAALLLGVYFIKSINLKRVNKIFIGLALLVIFFLGIIGFNLVSPGRLNSLKSFNEGSLAARINYYSAAVEAIGLSPVFGYGLENSEQVFIKYYRSDWGIYAKVGTSTDRAHNLILDILMTVGFYGLILFGLLYYYLFRLAKENIKEKKSPYLSIAILFGAFAYLISLMFNFSLVAGEIYFWLFLALLLVINLSSENKDIVALSHEERKSPSSLAVIFIVGSFFLSAYLINYEFRVLKADHYFGATHEKLLDRQYYTALTLSEYTNQEKTNPVNQEYYNRILASILSDAYDKKLDLTTKIAIKNKLTDLDKKIFGPDYQNILVKAKISAALDNFPEAEKLFQQVIAISPYWPSTYIQLANLLTKDDRIREAIVNYQLALKILPDINDRRINREHVIFLNLYKKDVYVSIADIYFSLKNYSEAENYYKQAYSSDLNDLSLLKKIADTLYLRGDIAGALEYSLRGQGRDPQDFNWPLGAAILYKESGDLTKARDYFDQAFKLAPNNEKILKLKADYK
ncbi:MAG: oligosaccharide repeat unit polymerase [Patescibacteria group bacterium]